MVSVTWAPAAGVANCHLCDVKFTFTQRKHHCRVCGEVVCARCTRKTRVIAEWQRDGTVLVCKACQAAAWVKDRDVRACQACEAPFTVRVRRHHCRRCGRIFCARCSQYSQHLPTRTGVRRRRVCQSCHALPAEHWSPHDGPCRTPPRGGGCDPSETMSQTSSERTTEHVGLLRRVRASFLSSRPRAETLQRPRSASSWFGFFSPGAQVEDEDDDDDDDGLDLGSHNDTPEEIDFDDDCIEEDEEDEGRASPTPLRLPVGTPPHPPCGLCLSFTSSPGGDRCAPAHGLDALISVLEESAPADGLRLCRVAYTECRPACAAVSLCASLLPRARQPPAARGLGLVAAVLAAPLLPSTSAASIPSAASTPAGPWLVAPGQAPSPWRLVVGGDPLDPNDAVFTTAAAAPACITVPGERNASPIARVETAMSLSFADAGGTSDAAPPAAPSPLTVVGRAEAGAVEDDADGDEGKSRSFTSWVVVGSFRSDPTAQLRSSLTHPPPPLSADCDAPFLFDKAAATASPASRGNKRQASSFGAALDTWDTTSALSGLGDENASLVETLVGGRWRMASQFLHASLPPSPADLELPAGGRARPQRRPASRASADVSTASLMSLDDLDDDLRGCAPVPQSSTDGLGPS